MSKSTVMVMGADTHTALLALARDTLTADMAKRTDDEALAELYLVVLVEEMIQELRDTDSGADAMERALKRVTPYGLIQFAITRGLVYDPQPSTRVN